MTLNASGPISLGGSTVGQSINLELGQSATALASINATNFRTLAGVASGQISLSNFYGKSNTVGFLATEVYASSTRNYSVFVATASSGAIYKVPENGNVTAIKYLSTGTVSWNRYGYVGQRLYVAATDSSNNYYLGGQYTAFDGQISKYNSSDALQWSTSFSLGSEVIVEMTRPVIDSSGNVYVSYRGRLDVGCCTYQYTYYMTKFDSSGVIQTAQSLNFNANGVDYGQAVGIGVDSSGNIYNMLGAVYSGYGAVALYQHNSSGTRLASKFMIQAAGGGGINAYDYLFDTGNNVGYFVGDNGTGAVFKHDTSLAITWCYSFTNISYLFGVALDSSGNVYAVGMQYISGTNGPLRIIKLNSSGTLQWARTISLSGYRFDSSGKRVPKISVSGNNFVISACCTDNACIYRTITFQAPTDGSGTGTISNAGLSWVYSSLTTSGTSKTISVNNNGFTGPTTRTATSRTPSIATSSWTSTITAF